MGEGALAVACSCLTSGGVKRPLISAPASRARLLASLFHFPIQEKEISNDLILPQVRVRGDFFAIYFFISGCAGPSLLGLVFFL